MNIFELRKYIEQFNNLKKKRTEIENDNSIDYIDRKLKLYNLQSQENEIMSHIKDGIEINDETLKNEVTKIVIDFLCKYGCSKEEIINSLADIKIFISDTVIGHGSLLVNFGNKIGIDLRFCDFTVDGNFEKFKDKDGDFLKYTLTHEMLHKCSIFKNSNNNVSFSNDALSEGFTDMLALMATDGYEYASKNYDFFVKVCSFFTNIIGIENIVDDYINNIGNWPNLKNVFYQCGLNDDIFHNFMSDLNKLLELTFMANSHKDLIPILEQNRNKLLSFLRLNILEKVMSKNTEQWFNLELFFDELFYEYEKTNLMKNGHTK